MSVTRLGVVGAVPVRPQAGDFNIYILSIDKNMYMQTNTGEFNLSESGSGGGFRFVVDAGGSTNFSTIQSAIDAAELLSSPASILVLAGTYPENLTIVKSNISIHGLTEASGATLVIGNISVTAIVNSNFSFSEFTYQGELTLAGTATMLFVARNLQGSNSGGSSALRLTNTDPDSKMVPENFKCLTTDDIAPALIRSAVNFSIDGEGGEFARNGVSNSALPAIDFSAGGAGLFIMKSCRILGTIDLDNTSILFTLKDCTHIADGGATMITINSLGGAGALSLVEGTYSSIAGGDVFGPSPNLAQVFFANVITTGITRLDTTMATRFTVDGTNWFSNRTTGAVGLGAQPDISSLLSLTSTTQGFLPPRMTTAQRDAIPTPDVGLLIYNTQSLELEVFDGTSWVVNESENIYNSDGTIDNTVRTVSGITNASLSFIMNNLTSSNFTSRGRAIITSGETRLTHETGDGAGGITSEATIKINGSTMEVKDTINNRGLLYDADYSANFTTRSLPDVGYFTDNSINIYTTDGVIDGNRIVAGEAMDLLIKIFDPGQTTFTAASFLQLKGTGNNDAIFGFERGDGGNPDGQTNLAINLTAATFTDEINSRGLLYAADYSANFTARSLIDKGFFDNNPINIYTTDGIINSGVRSVDGINEAVLNLTMYDLTPTTYLERGIFLVESNNVTMSFQTGDGTGGVVNRSSIDITSNQMIVRDEISTRGLFYAADYSEDFMDRSLIDKAYSDASKFRFVVDAEGANGTFTTIQAAVTAAELTSNPEVVLIVPGTYVEDVTIAGNNISLHGFTSAANDVTVIQGQLIINTNVGTSQMSLFGLHVIGSIFVGNSTLHLWFENLTVTGTGLPLNFTLTNPGSSVFLRNVSVETSSDASEAASFTVVTLDCENCVFRRNGDLGSNLEAVRVTSIAGDVMFRNCKFHGHVDLTTSTSPISIEGGATEITITGTAAAIDASSKVTGSITLTTAVISTGSGGTVYNGPSNLFNYANLTIVPPTTFSTAIGTDFGINSIPIKNDGTGGLFLADNGEYILPQGEVQSFVSDLAGLHTIVTIQDSVTVQWDADNWLIKVATGDLSGAELRMGWSLVRVGFNGDLATTPDTGILNANGEFVLAELSNVFITDTGTVNTAIELTDRNQEYKIDINFFGTAGSVPSKNIRLHLFSRGNNASGGVDILFEVYDSTLNQEVSNLIYNFRFDPQLLVGDILSSPYAGLSNGTPTTSNATTVPFIGNADATGGNNAITFIAANQQSFDFNDTTNIIGGDTTFDFYVNWTNFDTAFSRLVEFDSGGNANAIRINSGNTATTNFIYQAKDNLGVNIKFFDITGLWVAGTFTRITINHFADAAPGKVHFYKDGILVIDENGVTAAGITLGIAIPDESGAGGPIPAVNRPNMCLGGSSVIVSNFTNSSLQNFRIFNSIFVP